MDTIRIIIIIIAGLFIIPSLIILSKDNNKDISSPSGISLIFGLIILSIGIFLRFFLNLFFGIVWGLIFTLPFVAIAYLAGLVTPGYWRWGDGSTSPATAWERAEWLTNWTYYAWFFGIILVLGHIVFAMVAHFSAHRIYIFFWQFWPWYLLFY